MARTTSSAPTTRTWCDSCNRWSVSADSRAWWPAELFPKLRYNKRLGRRLPSLGLGRRRRIEAQAQLHRSVLQRMESLGSYSPPNLSSRSLERARNVVSPARPPSS